MIRIFVIIIAVIQMAGSAHFSIILEPNKLTPEFVSSIVKTELENYHLISGINYPTVMAIIDVESSFNRTVKSISNAVGLMQITEPCLIDYNVKYKTRYTMRSMESPEINIKVGVWYLALCYKTWYRTKKKYINRYCYGRFNNNDKHATYADKVIRRRRKYM